jgi:hypothetical protein
MTLNREITQDARSIKIMQWNQVLIRCVKLSPNKIQITRTSELLTPTDFITLSDWANNTTPESEEPK